MTLFELIKTDAFDEMLMAKFLATVTISSMNILLPDKLKSSINDAPDVVDTYIKMLQTDAGVFMKQKGD